MPHTGPPAPAVGDLGPNHWIAGRALVLHGLLAGTGLLLGLTGTAPALAGSVVCTTTLEAPVATAAPVAMTRCGPVQTVPELVSRRFYSYTAPFERGVSLSNQITDVLGIAMGGGEGSEVMGLGFPDQTIIWDGRALQNTTAVLLKAQSSAMPLRTSDLSPCFTGSLSDNSCSGGRLAPRLSASGYGMPGADPDGRGAAFDGSSTGQTGSMVRGFW